jgi:N-acyl-D-amino-acid deacylase
MLSAYAIVLTPTILLSGGTIYDGSGSKPYIGDVRIQGNKIIAVGKLKAAPGESVFQLKGLAVSPGFIDAHSHADRGIDEDPLAVSQLTQGITTAVVGQDGGWRKPVREAFKDLAAYRPAINFAIFSGHGGVRDAILKDDYKRKSTPAEAFAMQKLVIDDMKAGALGLSTGLEYDPGYYSDTNEVILLAKGVAPYKGIYISHVRDEGDKAFESFEELIRISKEAGIHGQISHIKLCSAAVWGRSGKANQVGLKQGITADVYPYTFWQSTMSALSASRDWANREIWVKALSDVGGAQNVRLTRYTHEPNWVGKTLAEIAKLTNRDAISIIQEILDKTNGPNGTGSQSVAVTAMQESDLEAFIASPRTMFCSDGSIGGTHPRGAGSFPRILGRYVRDRKVITLQEAIRKMTSFAAETLQIKNRGRLRAGWMADLVVFDPKTIQDHATTASPTALSTGVKYVWVSGVKVLAQGKATGLRSGKMVRRDQPDLAAQEESSAELVATSKHTHPESLCCGEQ